MYKIEYKFIQIAIIFVLCTLAFVYKLNNQYF